MAVNLAAWARQRVWDWAWATSQGLGLGYESGPGYTSRRNPAKSLNQKKIFRPCVGLLDWANDWASANVPLPKAFVSWPVVGLVWARAFVSARCGLSCWGLGLRFIEWARDLAIVSGLGLSCVGVGLRYCVRTWASKFLAGLMCHGPGFRVWPCGRGVALAAYCRGVLVRPRFRQTSRA
ncbi:hypothetical protein H6P81_013543 [Aristolochia fimbriata]|uniref:Uncharacterized protein n=1 Tax=Aristolochia fimbriata TaxID=158543 RepID=A0AAV7EH65_ARIFI|nr:hypothetical protein H6P81_013543 [Aristolochia fimbriata]